MRKRKAETALIPIFAEETKENLKKLLAQDNGSIPDEHKKELRENLECYAGSAHPYSYVSRIENILEANDIIETCDDGVSINLMYKDNTRIKTVIIDKSFEDWLDGSGRSYDDDALYEYMQTVSDEEATRLLKLHHLNMNLTLCLYPLVVTGMNAPVEDKNYSLSEEGTKKIQKLIEGVYGEGNVWVPGTIMPLEDDEVKRDDILRKAHEYFSGNPEVKLDTEYGIQENKKKTDFFPLCIPFVVKNEFNSSVYTLDQLYGEKCIEEAKSLTFAINKVRFLTEYEKPQNKPEIADIDIKKMTITEYFLSPETDVEFSIDASGFKEILANEIETQKAQSLLYFNGWAVYEEAIDGIQQITKENEAHEIRYFTFDRNTSYLDQFEEYFKTRKTASDIVAYLDAFGTYVSEFCGEDLDNLPDDEKENIVVFIDHINENYYQTIYKTMIERHSEVLEIFDIAEYYRFEMTAAEMKKDLENIDEELVYEAQCLVNKIWDEKHKQLFTFTIFKGAERVEEQVWKYDENTCSKAGESLGIMLTHFCAAMMMCGGSLVVRTFVDSTREEVYMVVGRNWDWRACSKKETEMLYTRLPNGTCLEPDKNTVFTEITKE